MRNRETGSRRTERDNLDVAGMAGQMSIDNHLSFAEDAEGAREMFRRERKARVTMLPRCFICLSLFKVVHL